MPPIRVTAAYARAASRHLVRVGRPRAAGDVRAGENSEPAPVSHDRAEMTLALQRVEDTLEVAQHFRPQALGRAASRG